MCGRKFLHQLLRHCLAKLCTKNYENSSIFVEVTAKKINSTFLFGHGVEADPLLACHVKSSFVCKQAF